LNLPHLDDNFFEPNFILTLFLEAAKGIV